MIICRFSYLILMQEIVQQAQQTAKFGMNVNMIDAKKSAQQNLRTFLVELNTKTLKVISEKLYNANCVLKKSIENSSFGQFKPKQQRNFNILQLSEEIASFANLISTNIYTIRKNGASNSSNVEVKQSSGQRQSSQNQVTSELTEKCESLQHQLANFNLENQKLALELKQKEHNLATITSSSQSEQQLKAKIAQLQHQIFSLNGKLKEKDTTTSANQERSQESDLQKENSQLKAKIVNLQDSISTLHEEIMSQKASLLAAETLQAQIENQHSEHRQEINKLNEQKVKLSEQIKKMKKQEPAFILSEQHF